MGALRGKSPWRRPIRARTQRFPKARSEWGEKGRRALRLAGGNRRTLCVGGAAVMGRISHRRAQRGEKGKKTGWRRCRIEGFVAQCEPQEQREHGPAVGIDRGRISEKRDGNADALPGRPALCLLQGVQKLLSDGRMRAARRRTVGFGTDGTGGPDRHRVPGLLGRDHRPAQGVHRPLHAVQPCAPAARGAFHGQAGDQHRPERPRGPAGVQGDPGPHRPVFPAHGNPAHGKLLHLRRPDRG